MPPFFLLSVLPVHRFAAVPASAGWTSAHPAQSQKGHQQGYAAKNRGKPAVGQGDPSGVPAVNAEGSQCINSVIQRILPAGHSAVHRSHQTDQRTLPHTNARGDA